MADVGYTDAEKRFLKRFEKTEMSLRLKNRDVPKMFTFYSCTQAEWDDYVLRTTAVNNSDVSPEAVDGDLLNFPTKRRIVRKEWNIANLPSTEVLENWRSAVGLEIGEGASTTRLMEGRTERDCAIGAFYFYEECNAETDNDVHTTDLVEYKVRLNGEEIKHCTPFRRHLSPNDRAFLNDTILDGIALGRFEYTPKGSPSLYDSAPVVILKDPTETIESKKKRRLTFNVSWMKPYEVLPAIRMSLLDEVVETIANPSARMYFKTDMKTSFRTIPLAKESRHLFAFCVDGMPQLQPTRTPEGAPGSAACLASGGRIAFGPIPPPSPEPTLVTNQFRCYQDDCFRWDTTFREHFDFLWYHYLPRMLWSRFSVGFAKTSAFVTSILCLGTQISAGGVRSIKTKRVQKILDWPEPHSRKEVLGFLGTVVICQGHIKNYANITSPLRILGQRKKNDRFDLSDEQRRSFEMIKREVENAVNLYGWDENLPVYADTDASKVGARLVLYQMPNAVDTRVLLFDSWKFTQSERNYGTYKRELSVIISTLRRHEHYFRRDQTAIIHTDHQPLLGFLSATNLHVGIYC